MEAKTNNGINKNVKVFEAKRAIFMCAGFGSRMVPVTLTTPKPLVKVNGIRIIDRLIDACLKAGIKEIIIVRGYLKHKFNELKIKYPMIKFVDNDFYNESNNIYSIYLVRDKLEDAYIFEGDLVLSNPNIISKYHESSDFLAIPVKKTDDWCFTSKENIITSLAKGGSNCFQEIGISYWNKQDGKRLKKDIEKAFKMEGGHNFFWESVPLVHFKDNYKVQIKECKKEDIVEIDTYKELCKIDFSYKQFKKPNINIDSNIISNITSKLDCETSDINNIEYMKIGLTNISFKFTVKGINYVYRNPGVGTKLFINRESEKYSEIVAKKLKLDDTLIWIDSSGWKLSKYVENSTQIDPYDVEDQKAAMKLIKKLHRAQIVSDYDFDYIREADKFIKMFEKDKTVDFSKYYSIHNQMKKINSKLNKLGYKKVLCHNDYWYWNILKDNNNKLTLIDWEYSGNAYPASDVAYFTSSLNFSNDDYLKLARLYEGHKLSDKEIWYYNAVLAIVMWYWFIWALYKESTGKIINDKQMWYNKAIYALDEAK